MIFFKKVYWAICTKLIDFIERVGLRDIFYQINYKKLNNNFKTKKIYLEPQISPFVGIGHKLGNLLAAYSICKKFGLHGIIFNELKHENWPVLKTNNMEIENLHICSNRTLLKRIQLPRLNFDLKKDVEKFENYIKSTKSDVVFILEKDQFYRDISNSGLFLESLFTGKISLPTKKKFTIGIHIRKGDILESKKFIERNIGYDYFNITMKYISEALKDLGINDYETVVFSNDYSGLNQLNFNWCPETSTNSFYSFTKMFECDILITSLSSFSYKPALINKNLVFHPKNFWHQYPNHSRYVELGDCDNRLIIKNSINTFFRKV